MSGAFRHKLALALGGETPDLGGGADAAPVTRGAEFWAEIERLSSTQDFGAPRGQTGRRRLKRIAATVRAETIALFSIDLAQRLLFDGDVYEVTSLETADVTERRITMICEEVAGLEVGTS